MYSVIDLDRLVVVHRHHDFEVACNLVDIELPDAEVCVAVVDNIRFFFKYTETELQTLYSNVTGATTSRKGNELRALLVEAINRLPQSAAKAVEVDRQAEYANVHRAAGPYTYVPGATRPAKAQSSVVATVAPTTCEATAISDAKAVAAQVQAARPTPAPKPTEPEPVRAQRAPGAPKASGVRATIWDKADELWGEAGKPTSKSEVLALRKRIMDELEVVGVKRTSSSNELGNWQKDRVVKIS